MDQESKEMLRKVLDLEQKNNKMLTSIKKSIFWEKLFRYIYYIVIVAAAIGAYYYIQPYIDQAIKTYGGFKGDVESFKNLFNK